MALKEIDALGEAIAATEKEIFGEANDLEDVVLDETQDRSREDMGDGLEGQVEAAGDDDGSEEDADTEDEADGDDEAADGEDRPRDDKGRFIAAAEEKADDKAKPDAKAKPGDKQPGKGTAPSEDGEPSGKVPSSRLREQTERARAAETERDALKGQVAQLTGKFDLVLRQFDELRRNPTAQPQPGPKPQGPPKAPDLFEDPQGFVSHLTKGFETQLAERDQRFETLRVDMSMQAAHGRHGELFTKAYDAVMKLDPRNPDNQMTVGRIWNSPNPGEALVTWHRNAETLQRVGQDPAAYEERIRTETRETLMKDPEFRKQLLEALRAEASGADGGRPRTVTRLPKSLNGTAGGQSAHAPDPRLHDDSDASAFEYAFSDA